MIAIIRFNDRDYKHFKVKSTTSNDWYDVCFLDGKPLCECSIKYNRNKSILCKHIKFILDNSKLL